MKKKKLDLSDLIVLNSTTMISLTLIWRIVEKILEGKISPTNTDGIMLLIFMRIIMFEKIEQGEFFWGTRFKKYLICFWYTEVKLDLRPMKMEKEDYTAYKWLKCMIEVKKEREVEDGRL